MSISSKRQEELGSPGTPKPNTTYRGLAIVPLRVFRTSVPQPNHHTRPVSEECGGIGQVAARKRVLKTLEKWSHLGEKPPDSGSGARS